MWPGSFYSTVNQPILLAGIKGNWNFYSLSNSTISSNALHQQDYCTHWTYITQSKKELWLLGDLAPFVRDRERNRETREYEVKVGVQKEKMGFPFFLFFPWKNNNNQTIHFLSLQNRFLFRIKGDEHDHKSNVSVIQGLKWNHTLTPAAKGTLNTSAHGLDSIANLTAYSSWRRGHRLCVAFDTHSGPLFPLHSFFTCETQLKQLWTCETTENHLTLWKVQEKFSQMNVQRNALTNTHLQLTSTSIGKTNRDKKVVTHSRVLTKWLSCTYPHIDQKLFWPKPVIKLFRRVRISDLSPSIKWAGGADSSSSSIEKVAERVRNSTLKLFPISCTVNVYCRAAARGSHTSHRSLSVLLQANQKLTERENKSKKSM